MPAPSSVTYSDAVKESSIQEVLTAIDAGAGAGKIRCRDDSDTLLADVPLDDPAGTTNGSGQLTLDVAAGGDPSADATGSMTYAEITDSDNNVVVSIPAQQGTSAVSGFIVMNTLSIVAGGPVDVISAVLG